MGSLVLTISPTDPLVINDAEIIVRILETKGNLVRIRVEADRSVALNRGRIYLNKKLSDSELEKNGYINTPLKDMFKMGSEKIAKLLEEVHEKMKNYDWVTGVKLPEKTLKLLDVVGEKGYRHLIELFFAKFLFVTNLPFCDESVLEFKKDFLGYEQVATK